MDSGKDEHMNLKVIGAIFIIAGCGCFGFLYAAAHRRETRYLRRYISALEFMECELQYRLTPLPELCKMTAEVCEGCLKKLFAILGKELEGQISPNAEQCMQAAIAKAGDIPKLTGKALRQLGPVLGRFDLDGQCKGLASQRAEAIRILNEYSENQETRLRSYQTLGICAGAAVVILFV